MESDPLRKFVCDDVEREIFGTYFPPLVPLTDPKYGHVPEDWSLKNKVNDLTKKLEAHHGHLE